MRKNLSKDDKRILKQFATKVIVSWAIGLPLVGLFIYLVTHPPAPQ
jgi:hypothetical protein